MEMEEEVEEEVKENFSSVKLREEQGGGGNNSLFSYTERRGGERGVLQQRH